MSIIGGQKIKRFFFVSRASYLTSNITVALILNTQVEHKKVEEKYFFIDRLDKYFFLSDKNEVNFSKKSEKIQFFRNPEILLEWGTVPCLRIKKGSFELFFMHTKAKPKFIRETCSSAVFVLKK